MADCPLGFTHDDKIRLDKLYVDMYEGRDSENLSVTMRLHSLEEERLVMTTVKIALFGDGKSAEGLIVKFERTIGMVRGSLWAFGITGIIGMALFTWALSQVVPAAKIILDDYYSRHPSAKQSMNDSSSKQAMYQQSDKW